MTITLEYEPKIMNSRVFCHSTTNWHDDDDEQINRKEMLDLQRKSLKR